ncbi:uncharacterized protein LOC124457274 [Xenia sp. Carnegie-2017]|uniref:uncharacterized protein LOC124457274 n=1 Tax=Xenia sp. Carnegie-2017 TaxID=2897299 RepID=UPI001F034C33|nr:uncharacterized protein LOC124457274 [Xenia sp. Carnegie-2017]
MAEFNNSSFINMQVASTSEKDDDEQLDEHLVEEVHRYRILWDTSSRGYKDTVKKNQAWKEISLKLNRNADILKRRWKNLRDGMMRCLKKIKDAEKSGAGASKTPSCKLFENLLFLKDFVSNRETTSNITLSNEIINTDSGSIRDDSFAPSPPLLASGSTPDMSTYKTRCNKRKAHAGPDILTNQTPKRTTKRSDRQDKIDLLLVNALSQSDEQKQQTQDWRSSNHLFCNSIVEILEKLPPKKNRMARVEIQQVLMKYEFGENE